MQDYVAGTNFKMAGQHFHRGDRIPQEVLELIPKHQLTRLEKTAYVVAASSEGDISAKYEYVAGRSLRIGTLVFKIGEVVPHSALELMNVIRFKQMIRTKILRKKFIEEPKKVSQIAHASKEDKVKSPVIDIQKTLICSKCKQHVAIENFKKNSRAIRGYAAKCNSCSE
jgi:hypothetical protein